MSTKKLVSCAVFTALITITTIVVQIPSPMSGYVNLGDAFVLLAAFMMGPVYGTIAAGLGSMIADLITGYVVYAPATLIIKALMALVGVVLYGSINKGCKLQVLSAIISGIVAELIMVAGYFAFSALLLTEGWAAAASIPGNLVQGAIGVTVSTLLLIALKRVKFFEFK